MSRTTPIPRFTLSQRGRTLRPTRDSLGFLTCRLASGPFKLTFSPDATGISLLLHEIADFTFPLHQLTKPLAGHIGTGGAWDGRLLVPETEPLLLFDATADFFHRVWRDDLATARYRARLLRQTFRRPPSLLSSTRYHVSHYHRQSALLAIAPRAVGSYFSLVIFKERPIDNCFSRPGWKELRLQFT